MFGRNDTNQGQDDMQAHDDIAAAADAIANDRQAGGSVTGGFTNTAPQAQATISPSSTDSSTPSSKSQADGNGPSFSGTPTPAGTNDSGRPVSNDNPDTNGLLTIKQQALQALTPLVGQLNQSPEEQFRTTMMMIQASDNHTLLQTAYEAAQKISDEKERAQALLDIVNEINYFTQQG